MSVVLVADDDPDIVALVSITLQRAGHEVETTADGEEAWEAFTRRRPDIVIVDVMMPRVDGLELTRRIRADPAGEGVPIVVVSAAVDPGARSAALAAGADLHVLKPFSPRELGDVVTGLLSRGAER
jgi:DNA-binding response OmpR family regulator